MKSWSLVVSRRLLIITLPPPHKMTFSQSLHHFWDGLFWAQRALLAIKKLQRGVVYPPPPPPPSPPCLRDLSLLVGLTCATTLQPLGPGSQCQRAGLLAPSHVNNIVFVTLSPLTFEGGAFIQQTSGLFLSVLATHLFFGFFVSLPQMRKAVRSPSINKRPCE